MTRQCYAVVERTSARDETRKATATAIVTLKRIFSAPRRVWNTLPSCPNTLPRLVPRDCISIRVMSAMARMSSTIRRELVNVASQLA